MQTRELFRERQAMLAGAMLAGMRPVLRAGTLYFRTTQDAAKLDELAPRALALFQENEGTALVLREADARRFGFDMGLLVVRIVLEVLSALDGVGLTAGVATALTDEGTPCNMTAAYHHDNVFVPEDREHGALRVLKAVQKSAAIGGS